jgi:methionyl-tRNA formyltransferase
VKVAATELGIPVSHAMEDVVAADVELAIVVAYGRIIPTSVLDRVPMLNLHFSLLPRWRGAAPVERAILAGDHETGVCVMKVEEGLDTGAVYARRVIALDNEVELTALREQLVGVGCELLVEVLADGVDGLPVPEEQHGAPTTAAKLGPEDLHLDWDASAAQVHRIVRLGRAWTTYQGKRLRVLKVEEQVDVDRGDPPGTLRGASVSTGQGSVLLLEVQPESRKPMSATEWLRGVHPRESEHLGSD